LAVDHSENANGREWLQTQSVDEGRGVINSAMIVMVIEPPGGHEQTL